MSQKECCDTKKAWCNFLILNDSTCHFSFLPVEHRSYKWQGVTFICLSKRDVSGLIYVFGPVSSFIWMLDKQSSVFRWIWLMNVQFLITIVLLGIIFAQRVANLKKPFFAVYWNLRGNWIRTGFQMVQPFEYRTLKSMVYRCLVFRWLLLIVEIRKSNTLNLN